MMDGRGSGGSKGVVTVGLVAKEGFDAKSASLRGTELLRFITFMDCVLME